MMAALAGKAEEFKQKGNEQYKAQQYDAAFELYTTGLQYDSQHVLLYSNRSLVLSKLNRYKEALQDALQCVRIKPQWAKGYLRKAYALQGLNKLDEVAVAATAGFKLTNDVKIKKDLVDLWLNAMKTLHKIPDNFELPPGITVLSKRYKNVLAYLFRSLDGQQPLTQHLTEECLCDCADQIEEVLCEFGESSSSVIKDWAHYVSQEVYPYTTDPKGKKELASRIADKTSQFILFLSREVDPSLYGVMRPILGLMVLVVINRTNILTHLNIAHHSAELMNTNIIMLLKSPVLKDIPAYHSLYIGRLSAVLDSFIGRGYRLDNHELQTVHRYCKSLQDAIVDLPSKSKDRALAMSILSNIEGNVLLTSQLAPPKMPITGDMTVEIAKQLINVRPEEVKAFIVQHQFDIESKEYLGMREVEDLLAMAGIFLEMNDRESALKAFNSGERAFFTVTGRLLCNNTLKLDQCPAAITPIRQLVLTQASLLSSPSLFADITVRWKSLFTEVRRLLVNKGLGSLYRDVFDWYKIQKSQSSNISEESIEELLTSHMSKEETLLQENAVSVLDCIRQQNCSQISQLLNEGEVVLEYIFFATTQSNPLLDAYCIVISSHVEPTVHSLNFKAIHTTASVIRHYLANLLVKKDNEWTINPLVEGRVRAELHNLMNFLLPEGLIRTLPSEISHFYISPDADIAALPLDMIPLSTMLTNRSSDFSVTTLFSSRELLRLKNCISTDIQEPATCCVVSDPNYDLSVPKQSISFFAKLMELTNLSGIFNLGEPCDKTVDTLYYSRDEAAGIEKQLQATFLPVQMIAGDKATVSVVLSVARPLLLHISTHSEAVFSRSAFRSNFWSDLNSSIILAGYNTYATRRYNEIDVQAGTGKLPALAIQSMDLRGTRLVFLSSCSSAVGESLAQEAVGSLMEAFFLAGAETVIATLWPISDHVASEFCEEFYSNLLHKGVRPSLALKHTRDSMQQKYEHLFYWGSFTCCGLDRPLL